MSRLQHPVWPVDMVEERAKIRLHLPEDKVLIAKLPKSRLDQEGQIIVPGSAGRVRSMRTTWGQVLSVGPKVRHLTPGDYVHFGEYAGMGRHDFHVDVAAQGEFRSLPRTMPQDRRFVVLKEEECDLRLRGLEDGELLPYLHDA